MTLNPNTESHSAQSLAREPRRPRRSPWIAAVVVALLVGIGIGNAGGESPPDRTDEITALQAQVEDLKATNDILEGDVEAARQTGSEATSELNQLTDRENALDARSKELDDREAALDDRESAITETEEQVAASTFGNGVWLVGEDIESGEYRTDGDDGSIGMCYYAFLAGTDADADIIRNNIVEGPSRVSLSDGDVFESTGCQEWELS